MRPSRARSRRTTIPDELYGIIPDDIKKQFEMREVIARIVDGSLFHEFKPDYGDTMVTGWAYIWGLKVGILGNNGVIYSEAANKASQFMQICDRDGIPLIFLHNVTGFMVGKEYERNGITKDGAKMLMVQSTSTVPKLSVLIHASQAAANYAMCGPSWEPRFLFAWPNSQLLGDGRRAGGGNAVGSARREHETARPRARRRRRSNGSPPRSASTSSDVPASPTTSPPRCATTG